MANTRSIRSNSHRDAVTRQRKKGLAIGAIVLALGGAIAALTSNPFLLWFAFIAAVGVAVAVWGGTKARAAGAVGEAAALELLQRLPADYRVFNQVLVPSSTGRARELDYVVVGANGVFVIEVKHNHGRIEGHVDDPVWKAWKIGRGGTRYATEVRNPVRQVRGATAALAAWLRAEGIKTWVHALVVFTNERASLDLRGVTDIPITRPGSVALRVLEAEPKRALGPQAETEAAIERLLHLEHSGQGAPCSHGPAVTRSWPSR